MDRPSVVCWALEWLNASLLRGKGRRGDKVYFGNCWFGFGTGLGLGELVDEFVEVADLAHRRLLDLLHANAAYDAGDQKARRFIFGA